MSTKKELFGIDGADHAAWTLFGLVLAHIITYLINPFWILIVLDDVFIGLMLFWVYTEYKQEKAMVEDGRHEAGLHNKPWKWSSARYKDMGYPFIVGSIYLTTVHLINLFY